MKDFKTVRNHARPDRFPWDVTKSHYLLTDLDSILDQALQNTTEYLSQFRFDADYTQKLETAFGSDFNQERANHCTFAHFVRGGRIKTLVCKVLT
ncbi:hypothetical protein F7734_43140 [Scytonema sp. UIC 10036]|uniref:hypothetical protein n=1 Tax=Scytonema sp. UIC 10036 TaxID=2304196 RepID=UPI0012DA8FBA|nr:hypothetical protein [Scytonema sp. UIC 10036]MUG98729.1 hypothetical protein [Scytonema sp. UIC 10036]